MQSIAKLIDTTKKEIALRVMDGSLPAGNAAKLLEGLLEMIGVIEVDSKSTKLKAELVPVKASIEGMVERFSVQ